MAEEEKQKSKIAQREEEILKFWQENKVFEKSLALRQAEGKEFTFYDGPPFATGTSHYGHILAGTIKDAIPRYKTMRGFHVPRRWGWDCHGLPIENIVEKELGFKTKKDIENYGIENFNKKARESVMQFANDWRTIVPRLGRWVDMDNDYRTMDSSYTESVWWAFKNLYDKGLIYEGFKSMHICPRCETTLSNFEVTQGYKEVTDISVYAKFKIKGEPNTYLVAWTTTPWTLPGNVALAINKDIIYCKIKNAKIKNQNDNAKLKINENENFIVSKDRLPSVFKDYDYEIVEELKGSDLVGKSYEPIFGYYVNDSKLKNHENGWKIYAGDFVATDEGTGIVHIAPAFGEDDYQLSLKEKLPFIQHVGMDGKFKTEVRNFAGLSVKPKEDPQKTDIEIIKNLAIRGLLFSKEKITHPYPHCWRCETPLLNYAASSWFVKVTELKDKLVSSNKKVNWIPPSIGEYRFGNWLSDARDWAISRSRFWGAPIPVWRCEKCGDLKIAGSHSDLMQPARNKYFVIRHGEAENNVQKVLNTDLKNHTYGLTELGRSQAKKSAKKLSDKKIDIIFASPFLRTMQTAEIARHELGLPKEALIVDERLREISAEDFDNKPVSEYQRAFSSFGERFTKSVGSANYREIKNRVGKFLYEIDSKQNGKNILIVSHDSPIWLLMSAAKGYSTPEALALYPKDFVHQDFIKNAEVKTFDFTPLPHDENYELDFHRPYIDLVKLGCKCGGKMKRVPEVFDCWFESGSMPYASNHYPFKKENFDPKPGFLRSAKRYPADFIAEGVDQTRGWFYSMMVLGVALFGKSPFSNVVVNGIILAEDGEKMSKRLKNYPDPMDIVSRYGADALRYYLLSSPAVKSEDMRFSEKGVDEVSKKIVARLDNVLSFYLLYASFLPVTSYQLLASSNVLDKWIKARLGETVESVTKSIEKYEIDRAVRPLGDFIEDLSVWYLRRSRERIKGIMNYELGIREDGKYALATLKFVLTEFSKILAPFMPFMAEHIFQSIYTNNHPSSSPPLLRGEEGWGDSVHLEDWPTKLVDYIHHDILKEMKEVRDVVSKALELRAKAGIKVRQPLLTLRVKSGDIRYPISDIGKNQELIQLIKDEVNVKRVRFEEKTEDEIELDTTITPELREEGQARELIRAIQDLRKEEGLTIKDSADLSIETDEVGKKLIEKNRDLLIKTTLLKTISFAGNLGSEPIDVGDGLIFKIRILK